ncbi:MAG: DUF1036 domain-containing protein [Synergistaceae bacterium]|nr:DUF1036 domain-containing protein [Synergistaceae bacterium]
MKTKMKFILAAVVFIFAVCFVSARADAAIKVTIKNNRSHSISFAFCWAGFDYDDDVSKGWYTVKAGETKSFTFKDAVYPLTSENFGYYAKGTPKGKKTLYWRGEGNNDHMKFYIHQSEAFTGSHNKQIRGGEKVQFRKMTLKRTGDTDGTATLTFNP